MEPPRGGLSAGGAGCHYRREMWDLLGYPVVLAGAAIVIPWVWIASIVLAAKLIGAPVSRAGLGIGPALIERRWSGTAVKLCVVPLGGTLALEPRAGRGQVLRRMALTFVGPLAVMLVATLALFLEVWSGLPHTEPAAVVGQVLPDSPAQAGGLRPGDRITAIEGQPVGTWAELRRAVAARPRRPTRLSVQRPAARGHGHGRVTLQVTPRAVDDGQGRQVGRLGIAASMEAPGVPVGEAGAGQAWSETLARIEAVYAGVLGLLFGRGPPETVGGPVVITTRQAARTLPALYYLLLSVLLAAPLCLLPLPPLPGGQLPLLGIELVRGRPPGRRGRWAAIVVGVGLLGLLVLYAFSRDLLRFLSY